MGKNGVKLIVTNGIKLINEKHIEEGLDHANLLVLTIKHYSDYRKHRHELVDELKKQPSGIVFHEDLAIKILMDCKLESL